MQEVDSELAASSKINGSWWLRIRENSQAKVEYETSDPMSSLIPSEVFSMSSARGILFVILHNGKCYAYMQDTHQKLCILNENLNRGIQDLFYNKGSDSVITSSYSTSDLSIQCRTTSIEHIRRGKPDLGFPVLESEKLHWPAYIQLDNVNEKIICSSIEDSIYYKVKVFDPNNYEPLYAIRGLNMLYFKIGPGILLLRFGKIGGSLHLKIVSVEDGSELDSFDLHLDHDEEPNFIELFQEKILFKQEMKNLQILNVCTSKLTEISGTDYMCPQKIIFLDQNQLFLTMKNHIVLAWDLHGDDLSITPFGDNPLWDSDFNVFHVTRDHELMLSYCRSDINHRRWIEEGQGASINISNILTGHCIAKIHSTESSDFDSSKRNQASGIIDALEGITAMYYDEERHQIYTANRSGNIHVWYN